MGQCGCGELFLVQAHPIAGTDITLAVDEYHGCQDCGNPLGASVMLFNPAGWEEWREFGLPNLQPGEPIQADDTGGNGGHGIWVPFLGPEDLLRAVREDEELSAIDLEEYSTLEDLLADHGMHLLQAAIRRMKGKP